jgi:hypothetical protein
MDALPALETMDNTGGSSPPSACAPPSTPSSCRENGGRGSLWLAFATAARTEEAAVDAAIVRDYHPQLSTSALVAEVRWLLLTERCAGRLVCRYLADLADRIHERQDGELTAYVDEFHATACFFDLGARETRERVRIGRALRSLPQIEAAFIAGGLSYSRVREVSRVARPETESAWLELARTLDMRSLERRVAGAVEGAALDARGGTPGADAVEANARQARAVEHWAGEPQLEAAALASTAFQAPGALRPPAPTDASTTTVPTTTGRTSAPARARTEWLSRDALRVTFTLSAEAWALLERALDGARHRAETPLSDADALEAVARAALAARNGAIGSQPAFEGEPGEPGERGARCTSPERRRSGSPSKAASNDPAGAGASAGADATAIDDTTTDEPTPAETAPHLGFMNDPAARLLRIIGRRGNWTPDELGSQSGLHVWELQHALLLLELDGRVRRRGGLVDPV